MDTDHEVESLVERARGGDRAAFDALAALYRPRLESVIRRRLGAELHGQVEATDLLQETLLRALGALERFRWSADGSDARLRRDDAFYRWLRGIALKVILEALKRAGRDRSVALEFEVSSEEPSPSRLAQRQERFERFEKAVESLSPDHRTALRLVRLEGLSVTEAARRMDRSPNAVSHLLIRALRKLRERFGETASLHLLRPEEDGAAAGEDGAATGDRGSGEEAGDAQSEDADDV